LSELRGVRPHPPHPLDPPLLPTLPSVHQNLTSCLRALQLTRKVAIVGKRTTTVCVGGDRNPLFKCVSQSQK